ncbi:hypothetical protein F4561_005722 [Lipingzhangella halophila]|uniref:Uncharacterized protein n=1 Tax=Lipingzhangella halophila TaxID=1783352 RepID=A0A7W7W5L3_9ACTN|nr:hypothetical protein [Lipingzhangella halophila]MBB4934828.1 hypothetical protein [Lipingzhangella halophila]
MSARSDALDLLHPMLDHRIVSTLGWPGWPTLRGHGTCCGSQPTSESR